MKKQTEAVFAFSIFSAFVGLFINTAMLLAIFLVLMCVVFEVDKK